MNNATVKRTMWGGRGPDTLAGRFSLVLVAFIVTATCLFTALEYARGRGVVLDAAAQALDARGRIAADRLEATLGETLRLVELWPDLDAAQDLAVDDIDKRLSESLVQLAGSVGPDVLAIAADTAGRVVAASDPAWIGHSVVADDGNPGSLRVEEGEDGMVLVARAPVHARADGRRLGTIRVRAPLPALFGPVLRDPADIRISAGGGERLHEGARLAGDSTSLLWSRRSIPAIGGLSLTVAVVQPRAQALRPLRDRARQLLAFALVLLLVTVPAALWLAGTTTAALRGLTDAAVAEGPLTADFRSPSAAGTREVRLLGDALADMVERLEASREELARHETLAAMGTMAAGLAHEVRTPLAVLRTSAETLGRRAEPGSREAELVSFIRDEVDRLDRLVSELLEFARPRPPEMTTIDLADVAKRALRMLEAGAAETEVALEAELTPVPVRADPDQLFQVVVNLATNAVQASPAGGRVRIMAGRAHGLARLIVQDSGPGVPQDRREEIFRPFVTGRRGGTGLGLSIVRRIVEAHGGCVGIDDAPGGGARFTLELPLVEAE